MKRRYKRISINELIKEHKKLVKILKYGNKNQLRNEAIKQNRELNNYKKLK